MGNVEAGRSIPDAFATRLTHETEPLSRYPIVFLGATGAATRGIAMGLAREGHQIIAGTRSQDNFSALRQDMLLTGAGDPQPLVADVSVPGAFEKALDSLHLPDGTPLHFFATSASGLAPIMSRLARLIIPLRKEFKATGAIQSATAEFATAQIKALVQTDEALQAARAANTTGPTEAFDVLAKRGHFTKDSIVVTMSSSPSNQFDPDNPDAYRGPHFYSPIARSKEEGVRALQERAERLGIRLIDIVAPEIAGTGMGKFADELAELVSHVQPAAEIYVPRVPIDQVVNATLAEVRRGGADVPRIRKAYIHESGQTLYQRPDSWNQALIPYL